MSALQVTSEILNESPETRRFRVNRQLSQRDMTYLNSQEARISPLARKLFGFPWTEAVRISADFVDVQKQNWVDWDVLEAPLQGLIEEHFAKMASQTIEENPEPPKAVGVTDPLYQSLLQVIENEVNPMVASHGGRVQLLEVMGERAFVRLEGSCQGCAMSTATLKDGIEATIRQHFPQIKEVLDTTDHAAGTNPYFIG